MVPAFAGAVEMTIKADAKNKALASRAIERMRRSSRGGEAATIRGR